jgi:O-antigen/teichoic acid export membrane protein
MPVLIDLLGHEKYALWVAVSSVTMFLSLSEGGFGQTVVNRIGAAYAQGDLAQVSQVQATTFVLYLFVSIPLMLLTVLTTAACPVDRWLLSGDDLTNGTVLKLCLAVCVPIALLRIPLLVFPAMLTGLRMMPTRLACETATAVSAAVASILAAAFGAGLIGALAASQIVYLLGTYLIGRVSARRADWARLNLRDFRLDLVRPIVHNSAYFFLMSVALLLDRAAVNLVITKIGSLALTAPMYLIINLHRVAAWSAVSALSQGARPYLLMWNALDRKNSALRATQLCTKATCALSALFVLVSIAFGQSFVDWWLQRPCCPSLMVLVLIAGSFYLDSMFVASIDVLVVSNHHRELSVMLLVKSIGTCIAAVAMGTHGWDPSFAIALSSTMGSCFGALFVPIIYRRYVSVDSGRYLNHFLCRPLLFGMVITGVSFQVSTIEPMSVRVLASAGAVALVGILAVLGLFDAHERAACVSMGEQLWNPMLAAKPAAEGRTCRQ